MNQALDLAVVFDDLGIDAASVCTPEHGEAGGDMLVCVDGQALPQSDKRACVAAALERLGPESAMLLWIEAPTGERIVTAWRNALWPDLHVVACYELGERVVRSTPSSRQRLEQATTARGTLLACRRKAYVMSPAATVEKFDLNASGWDGEPGGPGYPHFRWMRRYVANFARAAAGSRILDFGCGAGWVGIEAAKRTPDATLCFFDPSPEMVKISSKNASAQGLTKFEGRVGFGEDPPFPAQGEAPFELVISSGVVSFSPDTERWLDGVASAVAPGGTLVVGDIHRTSMGFRRRRGRKPVLPVREMNASVRAEIRAGLEARGFKHQASAGYQLTYPIPQAMHFNETRLGGVLTWPLLALNQSAAFLDRISGSPLPDLFDSWVMRFGR